MPYFYIFKFPNRTRPRKKCPFGAFDKVETNVPDFFGVENGRL